MHLSYGTKCIGVSRGPPVQPENQQDGDNDEDVFYTPPEGSPPQENAVAIPPRQNRFGMTYLLGILSCMSIFACNIVVLAVFYNSLIVYYSSDGGGFNIYNDLEIILMYYTQQSTVIFIRENYILTLSAYISVSLVCLVLFLKLCLHIRPENF